MSPSIDIALPKLAVGDNASIFSWSISSHVPDVDFSKTYTVLVSEEMELIATISSVASIVEPNPSPANPFDDLMRDDSCHPVEFF